MRTRRSARAVAAALLGGVVALAPGAVHAQSGLAARLADPSAAPGVDDHAPDASGHRITIGSWEAEDRVEVAGRECATPCTMHLAPGTYEARWASGPSTRFRMTEHRTSLVARPWDLVELGLGIGALGVSAVLFGLLAGLGDAICWDFSTVSCTPDYAPAAIGVGLMGVVVGVGLVFDSSASIDLRRYAPPRAD